MRAWSASRTAGATTQGQPDVVAAEHAGTNSNLLADELLIDAGIGKRGAERIPVQIAPTAW